MSSIRNVFCAIDPDQHPERLVTHAVNFTNQLCASQLILFHSFENESFPTSDGPIEGSSQEIKGYTKKRLSVLAETLETDANLRFVVDEGEPISSILAAAEREQADLVIVGTAGRKGLSRMVMGSVAEGVTRQSTIPVLVIRTH